MKRLTAALLCLIMCYSLVGCASAIELTNEQEDIIAEYIGVTLLKYSNENQYYYSKLNTTRKQQLNVSNNKVVPTAPVATKKDNNKVQATQSDNTNKQPTASTIANNTNNTNNTSGVTTTANPLDSMAASLGLNDATISYKKFSVGDKYPEGSYVLSVPAEPGCKIVGVEFTISNKSSSAIMMSTDGKGVSMKLSIGGSNESVYPSMLKNDLFKLNNTKLEAGASLDVFVLFQVPEGASSSIAGSVLSITSGGQSLGTMTIN